MGVPLVKPDLPTLSEVASSLEEMLATGKVTNFGQYNQTLEQEAAAYIGDVSTATVSSGTTGLILTLAALQLSPGAKVIVPSFTFIATVQAILAAGAIPIFADIDPATLNISVAEVERLLDTHEVEAVLAVHLFGLPAPAPELAKVINDFSRRQGRKIWLIFDAAHAFGATIDGSRVGSFGDAEVFSFSVTKALAGIEGGMISTRHPMIIDRVRAMRNYGIRENYNAEFSGLNGKMSELHATIGLFNLRRLESMLHTRSETSTAYRREIEKTRFQMAQTPQPGIRHTYKDFVILAPHDRDAIRLRLAAADIETRAYFDPPVHQQSYFQKFITHPLPHTERRAREVISLPFFTTITMRQIDEITAILDRV